MASSAEVAQPISDHEPISSSSPFSPKPAWGGAGIDNSPPVVCPWGAASSVLPQKESSATSFRDLMSEDLAKDIQEKEDDAYYRSLIDDKTDISNLLNLKESEDTSDDLILAQMLQYEFDREYDQQLNREEKQYNGNSKVSVSFNKFKICPTWYGPDSDDELPELDDENRAIDSFEAREREDPVIPPCGYVKQGAKFVTKHDLNISGRKNAQRIMNLPPGINTGDGGGFDMQLSNKVYNKLCRSAMTDMKRKHRVHDKVEKATSEMALDPKTRLLIFKLVNNAVLESVNGIISSGKEAVVFYAQGGELEDQSLPEDCAVKVFKTTLTDFKTRERYIREDYRFRDRMSKNNAQKLIRLWAEKEYHNLRRLHRAKIPSPYPILIKKHVLLMSFIGSNHQAAPKLKEACLSFSDLCLAYEQVVEAMVKMFRGCHLVHADLSEYNILWYENKCWIIDVGQAVEPTHPHALHFLHRDCTNIIKFFHSKGLPELASPLQLFEKVSGISLPGPEESALRMIEEYETHQELWREGMNNLSDQFEFLWQEIQAEESQRKKQNEKEEDEEDDEEELLEDFVVVDEHDTSIEPFENDSNNPEGAVGYVGENLQGEEEDDTPGKDGCKTEENEPDDTSKFNVLNPTEPTETPSSTTQVSGPSVTRPNSKSAEKQGKKKKKKNISKNNK
ncbi:serine/threonine-protein kinase RIO3-like [Homarus americanus]|uniref:serine/threonine-protein kinase RIO3-like n=1 Tax=Homarus americanus TaxID=6706 RepID=UPI001C439445|nr:serine/threonine-protein kinase RIO3-like [Homarus americanus]